MKIDICWNLKTGSTLLVWKYNDFQLSRWNSVIAGNYFPSRERLHVLCLKHKILIKIILAISNQIWRQTLVTLSSLHGSHASYLGNPNIKVYFHFPLEFFETLVYYTQSSPVITNNNKCGDVVMNVPWWELNAVRSNTKSD